VSEPPSARHCHDDEEHDLHRELRIVTIEPASMSATCQLDPISKFHAGLREADGVYGKIPSRTRSTDVALTSETPHSRHEDEVLSAECGPARTA
jgi:hypothetical protein